MDKKKLINTKTSYNIVLFHQQSTVFLAGFHTLGSTGPTEKLKGASRGRYQRFQPSRFDRESPNLMSCLPLSRFLPNSPDLL